MVVAVKERIETGNQRKTEETRFLISSHLSRSRFLLNIYHTIIINNNLFMRHRYQTGTFVF